MFCIRRYTQITLVKCAAAAAHINRVHTSTVTHTLTVRHLPGHKEVQSQERHHVDGQLVQNRGSADRS